MPDDVGMDAKGVREGLQAGGEVMVWGVAAVATGGEVTAGCCSEVAVLSNV